MVVKTISSFEIECLRDRSAGQGIISCWNADGIKEKIRVPLISAWSNPKNKACIRAHFKLELFRAEHRGLYAGLQLTEEGMPIIDENLTMILWKKGDAAIIRYGASGRSWNFHDRETGQSLAFFTCKQILVKEFIEYLSRWNQVAGLENVDFSAIDDEWLEEHGAIKIEDIFKKSVPMWAADFGHILRETTRKFGFGLYDTDRSAKHLLSGLQKLISESEKKDGR